MTVLPRAVLLRALGVVVALAILMAAAEAALVYRAIGPLLAAALGIALSPSLLQGARSGVMRPTTAWTVASVGCVICGAGTIGLDPAGLDWLSIAWLPGGVLAGSVLVWMSGNRLPPLAAVTSLVLTTVAWAGPLGVLRLGVAAEIVLVIAGLVMQRVMRRVSDAAAAAAVRDRELAGWQAEQEAFHLERELRLHLAGRNATPMLQRIIDSDGDLDDEARAECRVLEQTLRDEIRGRRLLNDAVRHAVLAQRRRGAFVQVLDDGGLDDLSPTELYPVLDDVARRLEPVRSSRIVIRTGQPGSATAVTIVATTSDETAVALGVDEEEVDMWAAIPRPAMSASRS